LVFRVLHRDIRIQARARSGDHISRDFGEIGIWMVLPPRISSLSSSSVLLRASGNKVHRAHRQIDKLDPYKG
jgi:hypothetical protein